jgi:hypothetical protein
MAEESSSWCKRSKLRSWFALITVLKTIGIAVNAFFLGTSTAAASNTHNVVPLRQKL